MLQFTDPTKSIPRPEQVPLFKAGPNDSILYPFFQLLSLDITDGESQKSLEEFLKGLMVFQGEDWEKIHPAAARDHTLFFPILSKIREILLEFSQTPDAVNNIYAGLTGRTNVVLPDFIRDIRFLDYKCRRIDYSTLVITFSNEQTIKLTLRALGAAIEPDHLVLTWR